MAFIPAFADNRFLSTRGYAFAPTYMGGGIVYPHHHLSYIFSSLLGERYDRFISMLYTFSVQRVALMKSSNKNVLDMISPIQFWVPDKVISSEAVNFELRSKSIISSEVVILSEVVTSSFARNLSFRTKLSLK